MSNPSSPLDQWPAPDRRAWDRAIQSGGVLDDKGPASHWAQATRQTNLNSYGRWLAFLANRYHDLLRDELEARCTPITLEQYVLQLGATTAPKSVSSSIIGLTRMVQVMAPYHDWSWLQRVSNKLKARARPSRDKRARILPPDHIIRKCRTALNVCQKDPPSRKNSARSRNVLMLAILAACPIRLKNMAQLQLGKDLVRRDTTWHISLAARTVKNQQFTELEIPELLTCFIDRYISEIRPWILGDRANNHVWLNAFGNSMKEHAIYLKIVEISERLFGRPINPHLLRDCAATFLMMESSDAAWASQGLLGHSSARTTQKFYVQAQQLEASRRINTLLLKLGS